MKESKFVFEYYRYQLVPKKVMQLTIDNVPYSVEQLKAKKNEFFSQILNALKLKNNDRVLQIYRPYFDSDVYILLVVNNRKVGYIKDLESKQIESEPYSIVIVDNDPKEQIISIRNDRKAFSSAETLKNIILKAMNDALSYYNIEMHVEPISLEKDFWAAIHDSGKDVYKITYEIIKPNITNISGTLDEEVRKFIDKTNSHKTTISIEASTNGQLTNINSDDKELSGLTKYSTEGAGRAIVKFTDKSSYDTRNHIKKKIQKVAIDMKNATKEQLRNLASKVLDRLSNEK